MTAPPPSGNRILDYIKRYPDLQDVVIDRSGLMRTMGIDLEKRQFITLSEIPIPELDDLVLKSLMWIEYLNETIATVSARRRSQTLEVGEVEARSVKRIMASGEKLTITEAKMYSKADSEFKAASSKLDTLNAYEDYLESVVENLNRYHYVLKARRDSQLQAERKY